MYLMIVNSEAGPYTSVDAMICGLVNISTNVGIFTSDVPNSCFVKMNWGKCYGKNIDYDYIANSIRNAWKNRKELSENARKWYLDKIVNLKTGN